MEYRKLGNTDVEITPIAFGAWAIGGWMWGGTDAKAAIDAIHCSLDMGITTIDTAPVYGFGLSEELVGEALEGRRDKVQVLTKFGLRWDDTKGDYYFDTKSNDGKTLQVYKYAGKEGIIKECEESLRRLKTDFIDLYQIHWPDKTTPISESMEAIDILLKQGKIRAGGVCNYSTDQMKEAEETVEITSNQVPYSMVFRGIEEDVVPLCLEKKKSILAYSPLQRGLLTGKITPDYQFGEGDHRPNTPFFKTENLKKTNDFLNKIRPIADDKGVSLTQLVIKWTIEQPGITCALVGARNTEQVKHNVKGATISLSTEEISLINKYLEELKLEV
ncbi:aldo/keto reductase [Flammeovirgaceae bacterium SG7u.111]|nr:aldo/keto reductase [Flammeovirgaceae bacterium SG7u.132]WPO35917.1 aldo/keto reductase [Flammeovirgaceae bacterium SG7u.111]